MNLTTRPTRHKGRHRLTLRRRLAVALTATLALIGLTR